METPSSLHRPSPLYTLHTSLTCRRLHAHEGAFSVLDSTRGMPLVYPDLYCICALHPIQRLPSSLVSASYVQATAPRPLSAVASG